MVSIPSATVEEALASMYRIAPEKRVAFRGRIKHFQRMGFPLGTNTGKGKPAVFTFTMVMELVLAFELVQSGLAPSAAASVVGTHAFGMLSACARSMVDDARVIKDPEALPGRDLVLAISMDAMWELTPNEGEYYGAVRVLHAGDLQSALYDDETAKHVDSPWRCLLVDARYLTEVVIDWLSRAGFNAAPSALLADLLQPGDELRLPYELQITETPDGDDP